MDLAKFSKSKFFTTLLIAIPAVILLLAAFRLGVFVGHHKARFSDEWGGTYERTFIGPRKGFHGVFSNGGFMNEYGTAGAIVKIEGSNLIISGRDNIEKSILVSTSTIIRMYQDTLHPADLKAGQQITVIGSPNNQGQIEAKFIRLLPESRGMMPR